MRLPAAPRPLSRRQQRTFAFAWLLLGASALLWFTGIVRTPILSAATLLVVAALAVYQRRAVAITAVAMVVILVIALLISFNATSVNHKRTVGWPPPRKFPILLVVKSADAHLEPHVVYYHELEALQNRFPEWSFIVAKSDERRMQKYLDKQHLSRTPTGEELWFPSFSVSDAGPNRERFEVYGAPDDDVTNRSWYIAEHRRIIPEYYESYGRGDEVESFAAFVVTFLVWLLITPVVLYYVHQRANAGARPAAHSS